MAKNFKNMTKAELEVELLRLQSLLEEKESDKNDVPTATNMSVMPNVTFTVPTTDVTVVYCSDSLGYASISNMSLHFNKYGEEFVMSRSQFDELVGKYRSWFDKGILTVSHKNVDIASAKGVKTDRDNVLNSQILRSIGTMTAKELEELWNSLDSKAQKESVITYYKRKFIENHPDFMNREKIDLLNRLTRGAFDREQDELSGRIKILPTAM